MADIVPDIVLVIIRGQLQGLLEAVERHVKLLGIEAAQTEVGEQLGIVDSHLKQPPEIHSHVLDKICENRIKT